MGRDMMKDIDFEWLKTKQSLSLVPYCSGLYRRICNR